MAKTIPNEEKVFMVSKSTNTTYSGSASLKAMQEWYTMADVANTVKPYKVYTALLTQSGESNELYLSQGDLLVIGVTYLINNNEGVDFTNVGAPNNDVDTLFVATGKTPNSWGPGSGSNILIYNTGAPVATVLENTIGDIWFTFSYNGIYLVNSNELFIENKTALIFGAVNYNTTFDTTTGYGPAIGYTNYPISLAIESIKTQGDERVNDVLNNTFIEIRVYN